MTLDPQFADPEHYEEWDGDDDDIYPLRLPEPYGVCFECGTPLQNWGAASHGDGDIFDEIGCPLCEEVRDEIHASYCTCQLCI